MSDVTIFMIGLLVFGLALASTMVLVISPSPKDLKRRQNLEETGRDMG